MRMMPVRVHATCLESLRRSTWLSGLLLLVCLMRVGMVVACVPHDIAESCKERLGCEPNWMQRGPEWCWKVKAHCRSNG